LLHHCGLANFTNSDTHQNRLHQYTKSGVHQIFVAAAGVEEAGSRRRLFRPANRQRTDADARILEDDDRPLIERLFDRGEVGPHDRDLLIGRRSRRRKRMTEGYRSCVNASSVPKSVSAETTTRFSSRARWNTVRSEAACRQ
jgi:hypothetical protein